VEKAGRKFEIGYPDSMEKAVLINFKNSGYKYDSYFVSLNKEKKMINWQERIHTDPNVLLGKPVVKGTRLSVEFLLERLANGWSTKDLLDNYPRLKAVDIQALFAYTLEGLQDGLLFPVSGIKK